VPQKLLPVLERKAGRSGECVLSTSGVEVCDSMVSWRFRTRVNQLWRDISRTNGRSSFLRPVLSKSIPSGIITRRPYLNNYRFI